MKQYFGWSGIKGHLPSTIAGALLFIAAGVSVFLNKSDWPGAVAAMVFAASLCGWKGGPPAPPAGICGLFLVVLLFAACTPQNRLNRLVLHHPELFRQDTVFRTDTIILPGANSDTVFSARTMDTVLLHNHALNVKYYLTHDSVYLQGNCAPDTVIRKVPVSVTRALPASHSKYLIPLLVGMIVGLAAAVISSIITRK